jgi:hypothetical protein
MDSLIMVPLMGLLGEVYFWPMWAISITRLLWTQKHCASYVYVDFDEI